MKSKIILFGILSSSQLIADCCQRPDIYCPTECNNTRTYTHPYYDLDCNFGGFVTADFLYWYAKETDLVYGLEIQVKQDTFPQTAPTNVETNHVFAPQRYRRLSSEWKPGFRVGLGFNSCCDDWDIYAHWTYFRSRSVQSTSIPEGTTLSDVIYPGLDQFALLNPWINQSFVSRSSPFQPFNQINAKWSFRLNSFDIEIGKKYWLSPCFAFRPYAAVRGALTRTHFRTESLQIVNIAGSGTFQHDFKDRFKNRYWGVGLLAGFQPNWHITRCLIIFGDLDAALIWGRMKAKKNENYFGLDGIEQVTDISYQNSFRNQFFKMQAILDLALGLRFQNSWCCNRFMMAIDLGWEHHIWLNHIDRIKNSDHFLIGSTSPLTFSQQGFRSFIDERNDLNFGGLVLRLRIDF